MCCATIARAVAVSAVWRPGIALRRGLLGLCMGLALSACEEELLKGLSESEANEIVALLHDAGVPAEKRSGADDRVVVLVDEARFSEAVHLLKRHGLPRQSFDSLADVFSGDGIVSSPMEEQARLTHALGQELSQTISSIDGVLSARVHVVLPSENRRGGKELPSSTAVFIRHERSADLTAFVPQIKTLTANAVAGLSYENVSVALFPAADIPVASAGEPAQAAPAWMINLSQSSLSTITGALGMGLLGGGLWLILRHRLGALIAACRRTVSGGQAAEAAPAAPVTHAVAEAESRSSAPATSPDAAASEGATPRDHSLV